ALVLMDQGRIQEAIETAKSEADAFWRTWALAIIYYAAGRSSDADDTLGKLIQENAEGNAYQIAEVYSMRGEIDEAFRWLEEAVSERAPGVTHAKVNPRFQPLRVDERWPGVLSRIGFGSDQISA